MQQELKLVSDAIEVFATPENLSHCKAITVLQNIAVFAHRIAGNGFSMNARETVRGLLLLQEFKNKGTWDALYIDEEIRVIRANTKNLFVLKRKRL